MAITFANYKIFDFGTIQAKVYELISDGSSTTVAIKPGVGFGVPVGNYTGFTESAGTFTITLPAGTNLSKRYIMFLSL